MKRAFLLLIIIFVVYNFLPAQQRAENYLTLSKDGT
jgi:hypothetical protein